MDYKELGLKIGLEIHQQLNTKKLFCKCPSEIRDDPPNIIFTRKLKASAGETGEIDIAAEYETGRERTFIYHAYNDTTCLVEMDEEPIHKINNEALNTAMQAAIMMNAKPTEKVLVMRKTVIDGSNTSGFQRTALIARNGWIETATGKIGIQTICIEEESAKIIEAKGDYAVYNLSRMGIPLIEVATAPHITSPEQVKEAAEHIGMILRSTGKAKRGLGTIRQDINVSIKNGARTEIKGAQELKLLPKLAELEALRQKNLIEISEELKKRKAESEEKATDITETLKTCPSELIQQTIKREESILAIKLCGFSGLVGKEIQPGRRLGKEFSEHARAQGAGGAIHSDELPKYGIDEKYVHAIRKKLACAEKDAFIFVADQKEKSERAIQAIATRAKAAIHGVQEEVRKANPDGTTSYLRPMPGSSRMYPETDITPIKTETAGMTLPELIKDKALKYEKAGLSKELASQIAKTLSTHFEKLITRHPKIEASFIASTILNTAKEIRKRHNLDVQITEHEFDILFSKLDKCEIAKDTIFEIFLQKAKGKSMEEAINEYRQLTDKELESEIKNILNENKNMPLNALIGKAMEKLKGKAEGRKIVEAIKKAVR